MVRFIYFDVGGVVVQDFSGTNKYLEWKRSIGIKEEQDTAFDEFFDEYEKAVCVGMDVEDVAPLIIQKFGLTFPEGYSLLKDFVDRFEKNESLTLVLDSIIGKFGIGLLTNMYPGMLALIESRGLIPSVNWDVIVDSSVEGARKPQDRIYNIAQKRAGVDANEILFVENSETNIKAAEKAGWQTFFYNSSDYVTASHDLAAEIVKLK